LGRLLSSLESQTWPPGARILIVDNDPAGSAAAVVQAAQGLISIPIDCCLEPKKGFSTVRNAALDFAPSEAAVCFLDDDAVVPRTWVEIMYSTSAAHPEEIVRSKYLFVSSFSKHSDYVTRLVESIRPLGGLSPAGTSGLLIPAGIRRYATFDPYFDLAGGEDMDLLFRLEQRGVREVHADTLVIEERRARDLSMKSQLKIATWNGHLETIIQQRNGVKTNVLRWNSLRSALVAFSRAILRAVLGRRQSASGYFTFAAGRWAMATASAHPPESLGQRPQG
jgi:glycosyltransferase involved in cell wall biosynthesis